MSTLLFSYRSGDEQLPCKTCYELLDQEQDKSVHNRHNEKRIIYCEVKRYMNDDLRKFEELMNRMFGEFSDIWDAQRRRHLPLSPLETSLTVGRKRPYIDIVESDKDIVATAEMPGMNKEDININLTSDTLELSAESKHEEEKKGKDYVYRERRSGNYYRSISLPSPVDSNSAKASYNNGILEIKMQKTEVKKKTSLKIE